mmetsp:Transcript_12292/g.34950  ORF Transcript_12292/g.34950 Transcript_12292/m.34950 type:complete len:301 (-) Transcript_12292:1765-2667(-)
MTSSVLTSSSPSLCCGVSGVFFSHGHSPYPSESCTSCSLISAALDRMFSFFGYGKSEISAGSMVMVWTAGEEITLSSPCGPMSVRLYRTPKVACSSVSSVMTCFKSWSDLSTHTSCSCIGAFSFLFLCAARLWAPRVVRLAGSPDLSVRSVFSVFVSALSSSAVSGAAPPAPPAASSSSGPGAASDSTGASSTSAMPAGVSIWTAFFGRPARLRFLAASSPFTFLAPTSPPSQGAAFAESFPAPGAVVTPSSGAPSTYASFSISIGVPSRPSAPSTPSAASAPSRLAGSTSEEGRLRREG